MGMRSRLILALLAMLTGTMSQRAFAATLAFDYKDPKEISAISLTLDSKLEPIVGYARGIAGMVNFDPANPQATTGSISVAVSSIQFANEGYTATARGYALNGDKYPQILFNLRRIVRVTRISPAVYQAVVKADFVCKGITLQLTIPVTASYYPGLAEERTNGKYKGDVLVLRTHFDISRKKLGISQGIPDSLVGDTIQVGVAVVGLHYAPRQAKSQSATQPDPARPADKQATPSQTSAQPSALTPTARVWKMEIEDRDDPTRVDAVVDLNAQSPGVTFATAQGRIRADHVTLAGGKLAFHLPDNPQTGAADGSAAIENNALRGVLRTKTGVLKFHARPKSDGDDVVRIVNAVTPSSTAFRDLTIEVAGEAQRGSGRAAQTLAERMRFHHVPAVSLARFENYHIVESGAFGVADVETGEPVSTNTLFQAGGMGSPLVNLLALRLAAQGRLDLNRAANTYLKHAQIPDNAFTRSRKVTVLDLVNGASGLAQSKFTGYAPDTSAPALPELMAGADASEMQPLRVTRIPGTFGGEGINDAILEQVLVDATGQPFAALMQENIFTPFGMTHSVYAKDPTNPSAHTIALGHYATGERMLDRFHVYPESGASGLWTTAGDMARMLCQVQLLLDDKPNAILTASQRGLLKSVTTASWTLGLIPARDNDFLPRGWLYHGGASYGYYANHATSPHGGNGVVVMENRSLAWRLNNEIIRAVGKKQGWQMTRARMDQPISLDIALPEIRADREARTLNIAQTGAGKNLVLFFFSEQCGVTFRYKQRLQRLQKEFAGKDFVFVGARCGRRENPQSPLALAETQYLTMPFVDDATGLLVNLFHVRQSLTFAVVDKTGTLRYYGGFDDNVDEKRVTTSYLPNALRALAVGKPIPAKQGRAIGCAILPIL